MILIALFILALVTLYLYGTRNNKYWLKRGIIHEKPLPLFGNTLPAYTMQMSMTQILCKFYWKYPKEKVIGIYHNTIPYLIVKDPEIVKRVLNTDFYSFHYRGLGSQNREVVEPMLKNLFSVEGDTWRLLRQRMTPAFTSGKLKAMFPLVCERAEKMQEVVAETISRKQCVLDAREVMARYTTDFIASVGFGLNVDSQSDQNSLFRKLGYDIFNITLPMYLIILLKELFPKTPLIYLKQFYKVEKPGIDLVKGIMKSRNYEPSGRNDFMDLMLESRKKGSIEGESIEKFKEDGSPELVNIDFDDILLSAQMMVFFAAGFETSSSATSFTLHELAFHPEVQKKVQEDIDRVLSKYNNKLCYDAVKEMTYLECAFKEGMRIFPSLGFLARKCARKVTIPEINLTIDPDVGVFIPIQAMHMDPQYFENPEEFRPERFHPDVFNKEALKYAYLPFGEGPRACIGERLGHMQSLAGLAAILSKFTVEPAPETRRQPRVNPRSHIVQSVQGGIPLLFKERIK